MSSHNQKDRILTTLVFPLYGVLTYLKKGSQRRFSFPALMFFIVFGLLFVLPEEGDASRHFESFQNYSLMTMTQFIEEFRKILTFSSKSNSDVYLLFSNFLISRFSVSSSIYFGFHALIYGTLFLYLFKLLFIENKFKEDWIAYTIFITLFLVFSIAKIQYVRFYLATLFFLYGCYSYLIKANLKFWAFFVLATLVHISLFIPSLFFILFIRFKTYLLFWFVLAVISFFSSNYLSQYSSDIVGLSSEYAAESSLESMTKAYVGNEEYLEQRANRFDERRWFTRYHMYLGNTLFILSIIFFVLNLYNRFRIDDKLVPFFTFSLLMFSISQFGNSFASVGERFLTLFIFSSLYFAYLFYPYLTKKIRKILYFPSMPFFILFIVMSLREIIEVASIFTAIGSSFLIPLALTDPISIYDFILK